MICSATVAWALSTPPWRASAAEPGDAARYTLGDIVVSGTSDGVEATQAVSTVTADDIRAQDARTLDQALGLLPGVNVRVGAEGIPRIDVRGFRTRHVVLLLDGIPINSAFDQQFDPSIVPTENIAEIKLTQGPSSVLYGQGGLGGVINIITKKGAQGLQGAVGAEAGDRAPYLARASLSGATGLLNYFASGSAARVNAFPLSAGFVPTPEQPAGYRWNSDRRRNSAFGNVGLDVGADLAVGLTLSYAQGSFGKPSSVVNDPLDPFATPPRYARVDDFENVSAQAAVDWQATRRFGVRAWAFVNRLSEQDTQYDDPSYSTFDLVAGSFRQQVRSTVGGASAQPKLDLGAAGVVTFLLSAERDGWDASGTTTVAPGTAAPIVESYSLQRYSTAVEYEVKPLERLGLVAGYGHHWQARGGVHDDGFSTLAAAYVDVLPATRLKASYNHNVRFPTLRDLYDPSQGNPDLVPERADTVQGGVEQRLPWQGVASATAWYTSAHDLIQTDPASGRSTNLTEIRFVGLEVAASARVVPALLLRASFTYLDSQDLSREGRQEQQYTPKEKVTAEASYDFGFGLTPYVAFLFLGDQYYYTKNAVTPVQKGRLGDLVVVDVKLTQRLLANRLSLYAGASNLFDHYHETAYGFPQPGRFVYGGAEVRF